MRRRTDRLYPRTLGPRELEALRLGAAAWRLILFGPRAHSGYGANGDSGTPVSHSTNTG